MVKNKKDREAFLAADRERSRRNRELRRKREQELRSDLEDVRGDLERELGEGSGWNEGVQSTVSRLTGIVKSLRQEKEVMEK